MRSLPSDVVVSVARERGSRFFVRAFIGHSRIAVAGFGRSTIAREKRTDFTAKECRCLGSDVKIKRSRLMSQGYRTTYCLGPGA